ncbi:hypothetical protein [Clostridium septicum]|nr:hypothetical protein [Clostridium septicum]MDU1315271.1 hypothetical protein [Clostridium septicum]WLF70595.1 hypothetical protein Q6375_06305 [Clostridium septicum]
MANIGVLKHRTIRNNGTFSYFAVGEKYKFLISENTIGNKSVTNN